MNFSIEDFGLKDEDVINIYPFGSRVYGSNNEKSDYDYWVIVKDSFTTPENGYLEVSKGDVDFNIYKYSRFIQKLDDNELQALMCAFLPKENVYLEKERIIPKIQYMKLKVNVLKEASRHLHSLAPKLHKEKKIYQAKKMECQSIRDLLFGIQIVKHGKIIDYAEANSYFDCKDVGIVYEKLIKEFTSLVEPEIKADHPLQTISFINQIGLKELNLYYDIKIKKHNDLDLYILSSAETSPNSKKLVKECSGIIVNGKELISYPMSNIYLDIDYNADRIDWKTANFSPWIEGFKLIIFYYKDMWILHSKDEFLGYFKDEWVSYKSSELFDSFKKIWKNLKYDLMIEKDYCFNFVINIKNAILNYDKNEVILIGCRDLNSLKEIDINDLNYNWKKIDYEKCTSLGEVVKRVYETNPVKEKGYIIKDSKFNRIKVISPQYSELLKYHESKLSINLIELVVRRSSKDFLSKYKNLQESYDYSLKKYQALSESIQNEYHKLINLDKKETSKLTEKSQFKLILRKMKDENESNVQDFLSKSPSHILEKLFN